MTTRDTPWPDGTPCWTDLTVGDLDAARLFYENLFGWTIEHGLAEFGGYATCLKDGRPVCAIAPKMSSELPSVWTTYLASSDAVATAARITAAGGRLTVEPMQVADFGTMAMAVDPSGASFGLWQADQTSGAQLVNEPGAVIWNEHLSPDWQASRAFYASAFGWTYHDVSADGFNYASFQVDGRDVGGIGDLPADADQPVGHWSVYFAVENTDEAVDQLVKLGGNVLKPPQDTPYGRLATVSDPEGAVFALMSELPGTNDDATG
ncbi:MAG: VOC family protein [Actinomycetota bacterium]|nr:VOC family protein [Actinomycetota bacterium]MDQ2956351.1 VOC family protein [Actinomycetota bacterium]